jgi:hypothetical protein
MIQNKSPAEVRQVLYEVCMQAEDALENESVDPMNIFFGEEETSNKEICSIKAENDMHAVDGIDFEIHQKWIYRRRQF